MTLILAGMLVLFGFCMRSRWREGASMRELVTLAAVALTTIAAVLGHVLGMEAYHPTLAFMPAVSILPIHSRTLAARSYGRLRALAGVNALAGLRFDSLRTRALDYTEALRGGALGSMLAVEHCAFTVQATHAGMRPTEVAIAWDAYLAVSARMAARLLDGRAAII